MVALFLRPDADQSDGSWLNEASSATNLFNSVDEATTPSDTDYIVSSTTDGDKVRLRLSDPSGGVAAPLIVRYRCKRTGTQAANLIGRLYQGTAPGTLITTFTQLSVPDSFTTYTYTLTSAEFTSITDFTDLYVEFELSQQSSLKVDLNFAGAVYYDSGTVADATGVLSCTRASSGYAKNADGTLTSFASNTLRIGVGTGLLVEDASTNIQPSSQDFTDAGSYALDNLSYGGTVTAPDGASTAQLFTENTVNGYHRIRQFGAAGSAGVRTCSIYLKNGATNGRRYVGLHVIDSGDGSRQSVIADLVSGTIASTGTSSTAPSGTPTWALEPHASGWYRLSITRNCTGACEPDLFASNVASPTYDGFGLIQYTGDNVSNFYPWGLQNEAGAFPTSYIPTSGSTTRAADAVSCIGNLDTLLKASARTSVVSLIALGTPVTWDIVSGSTAGNELVVSSSDTVITSNTTTKSFSGSGAFTNGVKVGAGTSSTATSVTGAGLTVATGASGAANTGTVYLGSDATNYWYGYIRRATFWNSKLADATIQTLTAPNAPFYVFSGVAFNNPNNDSSNSTDTQSASFDLGAATADRRVIVGIVGPIAKSPVTSITAAGTSLTFVCEHQSCALYSGIVPSGSGSQTVTVVETGDNYIPWATFVWVARGLTVGVISSATADTDMNNYAIVTSSVNKGDLLFAVGGGNDYPIHPHDYSLSTEQPDGYSTHLSYYRMTRADWIVDAANSSFSVNFFSGDPVAVVQLR